MARNSSMSSPATWIPTRTFAPASPCMKKERSEDDDDNDHHYRGHVSDVFVRKREETEKEEITEQEDREDENR